MESREGLHESSKEQGVAERSEADQRHTAALDLLEAEGPADMPTLEDASPRLSKHVSNHAEGEGTRVRGKSSAGPEVRRSERLKRRFAVEGKVDEAGGAAAPVRRKRGRPLVRKGAALQEAAYSQSPAPRTRKSRKGTCGLQNAAKDEGDQSKEKNSELRSDGSKSAETAVLESSGAQPTAAGRSEDCHLDSGPFPEANPPLTQQQGNREDVILAPKLDSPDRNNRKRAERASQSADVTTPVPTHPSPNGATSETGGALPPDSNPPSSIARLAAALEGFAYQRGAVSDMSSLGVRNRTPFSQRKTQDRSMSPSRGSLSAGHPVASPSVSFEGGRFPQGSANSSVTGGSVRDQHGDSHAPPRKVSKRQQRASLKVIAPGEKVGQAALSLIADGKRVTAEGIRALIPEESEKKGAEGLGGGGVKRPAGVVDPDWVPPVSPYGLIQEELWRTPWKLLVACLLLNVTSGGQMRRVIWDLFKLIPTPEAAIAADTEAMGGVIHSLGLQNKRAATIQRFSQEYLEHLKDPAARPLAKVHGIGKYAADAHAIFCEGRWQEVLPHDHVLNRYWEWMWATRGEGAAFKRDGE